MMTPEEMLLQAGPGHIVVGQTWREQNGSVKTIHAVFPIGATHEEIDAWKRENGWPGHQGRPWDYFKDWLRGKFKTPA